MLFALTAGWLATKLPAPVWWQMPTLSPGPRGLPGEPSGVGLPWFAPAAVGNRAHASSKNDAAAIVVKPAAFSRRALALLVPPDISDLPSHGSLLRAASS